MIGCKRSGCEVKNERKILFALFRAVIKLLLLVLFIFFVATIYRPEKIVYRPVVKKKFIHDTITVTRVDTFTQVKILYRQKVNFTLEEMKRDGIFSK